MQQQLENKSDLELIALASSAPIRLARTNLHTLEDRALASFVRFRLDRSYPLRPVPPFHRDRRHRIMTNYLRHVPTEYDRDLEPILLRRGLVAAALLLRRRILQEICNIYPELADECSRQEFAQHTRWGFDPPPLPEGHPATRNGAG